MFRSIVQKIARDKDFGPRTFTLDVLSRVRDGALYDHMEYGFHVEKTDSGEYVPLRDRRPSTKYNLCRLVVDDAVALLFSEGHFPTPETPGADTTDIRDALLNLAKDARLNEIMIEAATAGSIGSIAVQMRVLKQRDGKTWRVFFEPHDTLYLTPFFDPSAPDTLLRIVEKYKVRGEDLAAQGYAIPEDKHGATFWFQREWDETAETWFLPWAVGDDAKPEFKTTVDKDRTVQHDLGFVPWVWIKNLPGRLRLLQYIGAPSYSDVDGACTFAAAIETMIEIDYQLSQSGRGLKYSMDPLLVLKEPPAPDREYVKSPANALIVDGDKGDAKLLEISGSSFEIVIEWVRALRELALETVHGNRADASKLSAAQSGRAMELMNQALIWLADKLRISYGEYGYRKLLQMALAAHAKYPLTVNGEVLPKLPDNMQVTLNWPTWFTPTASDLQSQATTVKTLRDAKVISKKTAVANIAFAYDIENVEAELVDIMADQKADIALIPSAANVAEQVRVSE